MLLFAFIELADEALPSAGRRQIAYETNLFIVVLLTL
jgi:hypothetical protein